VNNSIKLLFNFNLSYIPLKTIKNLTIMATQNLFEKIVKDYQEEIFKSSGKQITREQAIESLKNHGIYNPNCDNINKIEKNNIIK
jgi:hypothetical protein